MSLPEGGESSDKAKEKYERDQNEGISQFL